MRKIILHTVLAALLCAGLERNGTAAEAVKPAGRGDLVLRLHFAGMNQLIADRSAAKLKQIWSLPETAGMLRQTFDRLARVPFQALSDQLTKGAPDQAALFRPLCDDLLLTEVFLDWRGPAQQPTDFVFCLQLSDPRAQIWSKNLQQALDGWKLGTISAVKSDTGAGWVFKHRNGASAVAFTRAGQWVVIGLGPASLKLNAQALQQIKANGRPVAKSAGHWLEADADLLRLKPWLPPLSPYQNLPVAHLALSNLTDNVRTAVRLEFAQPHGWKSAPWSVPAGIILDPVRSFTVARGIAPLLQPWKAFQRMAFNPMPDQVTLWAQAGYPWLTHFAAPLANARAQLNRIEPLLPSLILANSAMPLQGTIGWDTNHHNIFWLGLGVPMLRPNMSAFQDRKGEFLLGSLFLPIGSTNQPPPELFQQVQTRPNLVYYDWEITQDRLNQWRTLFQMLEMAANRRMAMATDPNQVWLQHLSPLLGNTVTEITATSPTEMTFIRKSHSGFTGFELVSLTRWLDSPNFPRLSLTAPPKVLPAKARPKTVKPQGR